ncbi:hypothetical protein O3G_MSEX007322 [Manduca sexta]|uniref:CUB domain-containing protein n=1 Tax=Manduca sexta TaxID=7130 RepID=A0A921Z714_MANSE|nr:hypothetical protein O3G_MSEX007322 [Manduca sexta]
MKLILLCLFVVCGCIAAQDKVKEKDDLQDYYDDYYDYDFLNKQGIKLDKELKEAKDSQVEESKEEVIDKASGESQNIESIETLARAAEDSKKDESSKDSAETRAKEANEDYALLWGDEHAPLQPPIADDKAIFDETQELLNEDDDVNDFDEEKKEINLPANDQSNLEEIFDETKKLLADNEDDFDLPKTTSEKPKEDNSPKEEIASEEDTVAKVKEDLDEDLRQLYDTLQKLSKDDSKEPQDTEEVNGSSVLDYEEKYGKPYHEGLLLSQRDDDNDYEEMDSNLSELFAKHRETSEVIDSGDAEKEEYNFDDDVKESAENKTNASNPTTPIMYKNDALVDESQKASSDEVEQFEGEPKLATKSEEKVVKDEKSKLESTTESQRRTKMVDELSSAELDDLMQQFAMVHSEDLDVRAPEFSKNVAPIHITLSADKPTVVTSPNYPNNYPTNNIIDWIIEGRGMGIEMNVTSFAVNGAIGDYVLVKPGGIDDSGHEGIIFTYHLNSERRFRFSDVDRLFLRFESKIGMSFTRGFSISFKMMTPPEINPEDMPEPEAVLTPPQATMTVNLAGVDAIYFKKIREDFRELIADMATEYISDNKIDRGKNATIEITQITNHGLCNIHWPGHEQCVTVTFGVPLTYEEGMNYRLNETDLQKMWKYIEKEDFSKRMELLGIEEFIVPDDQSVLMMWLLIGAGVVVSMAMLAFALWRFSCFDDYTRMQAFSDTDSIKAQKRDLDLYPTPHQTLPPLYSENDYKWPDLNKFDDDARVDIGGFANRSYIRDDLYDLDYEEEVPNNERVRNSLRDNYSNV